MKVYLSVIFYLLFINSIYSQSFTKEQLEILSPTLQEARQQEILLKMQEEAWQKKFESDRNRILQDFDKINSPKSPKLYAQDFNPEKAHEDLKNALNPTSPSIRASARPESLPTTTVNGSDFSRFANSPCFQTLGYIPNDPGLEERYRRCEESKRNDQIAKIGLWAVIIAGLLGIAWFSFKSYTKSK